MSQYPKHFFSASQEAAPPPPPAFKPFSMTCKEEGCDFVTDTAEDEAHLPLVMKVRVNVKIVPMMMLAMLTCSFVIDSAEDKALMPLVSKVTAVE